jgi:hypothetical protein
MMVLQFVVVLWIYPETKGISFEMIQEKLGIDWPRSLLLTFAWAALPIKEIGSEDRSQYVRVDPAGPPIAFRPL